MTFFYFYTPLNHLLTGVRYENVRVCTIFDIVLDNYINSINIYYIYLRIDKHVYNIPPLKLKRERKTHTINLSLIYIL